MVLNTFIITDFSYDDNHIRLGSSSLVKKNQAFPLRGKIHKCSNHKRKKKNGGKK